MITCRLLDRIAVLAVVFSIGLTAARATSTVLTQFPTTNGEVIAMTIDSTRGALYLAGSFTQVGGLPRNRVAAIDLASGAVLAWNPGVNGVVYAMVASPTTGVLYLGGDFSNVGGSTRTRLAAVDATGTVLPAWDPVANLSVRSLGLLGNTLYVGGFFTAIGISPVERLVSLNATTGQLFGGFLPNPDAVVYSVLPTPSAVYAGGLFTTIGGASRERLAALSPSNGTPLAGFTASASNHVSAMVLDGGVLYLAGNFTAISGSPRSFLAAIHPTTGALQAWNPGTNGSVATLAKGGPNFYVGGGFSIVAGIARSAVAAVDSSTGVASTWAPVVSGGFGRVNNLAVFGSTVFLGGSFTAVNGVARQGLAAVNDSDLGSPLEPVPVPPPVVPSATITARGKLRFATSRARVTLRGTAGNATVVRFQSRKGGFKPTAGSASRWKISLKLKAAKTRVKVRAEGPGGASPVLSYLIRRK